jgi:DNA primase catalytic core
MGTNHTQKEGDNIYEYLKTNIKIENLADRLKIDLEERGDELAGMCPSGHPSKSRTSFLINKNKQVFFCHNCKEGGGIIELVELATRLKGAELLNWFKREYNLGDDFDRLKKGYREKTDEEKQKEQELKTRDFLLEEVVKIGKKMLYEPEGKETLNYLINDRKYDEDKLKTTEFIHFPKTDLMKQKLYIEFPDLTEQIKTLKLNGHFEDNFRLAFPYRNRDGMITGLLKRSTNPKGENITTYDGKEHKEQRWDSTPGTSKDDLFGLDKINTKKKGNEEKKEILDTLIILEGYPDAIYLPTLGVDNIVAIGQGVLGEKHLDGLKSRGIKNVILALDNDGVGPKNTETAIKLLLSKTNIRVAVLNPNDLGKSKDPDEYVIENGVDEFKKITDKATSAEKWIVKRIFNKYNQSDLDKQKAIDETLEFSQFIRNEIIKESLIDELTSHSKLNKSVIKSQIRKYKGSSLKNYDEYFQDLLSNRLFPFIEKATSSYAYYDKHNNELYIGVAKEILQQILESEGQYLPNKIPVLKVVFDVHSDQKIDLKNKLFNLFTPTEYLLLKKNNQIIKPTESFRNIYLLISNLFPKNEEKKAFLNWLAGIMQTREKQLTAWLLMGEQGTGKGVLLHYILKPLFGSTQAVQIEDEQLRDSFNRWLENKMIIAFNEVAYDNSTRNSANSKIKAIITDPELQINEKNVKAYFVRNYANCLFYSNESIPVLIEVGDRRFNVVKTGSKMVYKSWFSDPDKFFNELSKELPYFAQYLMNLNYDPVKAKAVINNENKESLINVAKNRYQEFSERLKAKDWEWLNDSQISSSKIIDDKICVEAKMLDGKILKDTAVEVFNKVHPNSKVTKPQLTKQLELYGIKAKRLKENDSDSDKDRKQYYIW